MKSLVFKKTVLRPLILAALSIVTLTGVAKAGGDSYAIYLNSKLVMKQYVAQPLSLASLPLDNAAGADMLVVYYSHCGTVGKGRSISVKDEHGTVLKEWKFADVTGKDNGMAIPVKDLQLLQKQHTHMNLYYAAQQLPGGRLLTTINSQGRATAGLDITKIVLPAVK